MAVSRSTTQGSAPTPRTKPASQRRRDLLDAGLEVFTSKGVAAATLDQITRAANVAKGTFYLHFQSKEHLLAALQDDFEAKLVQRADMAVDTAGVPAVARLESWVRAAFTHYPDDIALHDVLFHHPVLPEREPLHPEDPAPPHRDLPASLADLVEYGRARDEFDVEDVEITAVLLCSALHRMFDQVWHRNESVDPDRLLAATLQLFLRALRGGDGTVAA